ncbi:hypothetical protein [Pseudooctadecabacter sp.]|uniref:hypothetical protein n=1 Tax=Pseudooctadecabacter sp. TaxID=1966338 RepID=UPI0025D5FE13|nr:hypothetical protein [Pseudooctadecabacter sp.]
MSLLLLAAVTASFVFVIYTGLWGDPASTSLIGAYVAASLAAWALSMVRKTWSARVKWAWIGLSLVVIYVILSGPLNFLRLG